MAQTTACTRRVAVTGASGGIGAALLKATFAPLPIVSMERSTQQRENLLLPGRESGQERKLVYSASLLMTEIADGRM